MFELLYFGRAVAVAEQYPRETIAAVAAVFIAHEIASVKKEKMKLQAAKIELECELIRLKTAETEARNRH